ncbi:1035_t:CDS:1 [Entrophospora sp. SA101]|nr:6992_t:CDS:1 [Entrophospora sp. SA101]CAJ0759087.1 1035_t:CDS:1 [Entrophospora sp. SA101]CAJ0843669.1 7997_t:CDS:1 [Entrophospora sp. SA101]CAJ0856869.1 15826_t:CDS:1 [Entrophospora sp. SA101]CAJ0899349.1 14351_t:CDS:1 [Entrophospora sp. SA101]
MNIKEECEALIEIMHVDVNVNTAPINDPNILRERLGTIKDPNRLNGKHIYRINFREVAHRVSEQNDNIINRASTLSYRRSGRAVKARFKDIARRTKNILRATI